MNRFRITLIVLAVLALTLTGAAAQAAEPRFEPADCAFSAPEGMDVSCGFVIVPENWETGEGELRMAVARWASTSEAPAPDPVVFLQGGPGGGGVMLASQLASVFVAPILESRDFITYDQRGTGLSTPALNCPEITALTSEDVVANYSIEELGVRSTQAFAECADRLRGQGIDLSQYTSAASARDLAAMLNVLGVEQANFLGGSYGTRLAQTVARDFPERVRSLILDSPIPVDYNIFEVQGPKFRLALDALFAACADDPVCAAAYPNLETMLFDAVDALNRAPAQLELSNPLTGETVSATVDGVDVLAGVFFLMQQSSLIPTVPATIAAVSEGDLSALTVALTIPLILTDQINIGMFLSVNCAEEAAFTTAEKLDAEAALHPELQAFAQYSISGGGQQTIDICRQWGAAQLGPIENQPVVTDIPTLILAGQFDPATPPAFGEALLPNLANGELVVIPGAGHTPSIGGGCPLEIITSFLADPAQGGDASCVAGLTASFAVPGAGDALALTEVTSESFGWTTVIPEGWTEVAPGTYAESMSSVVALVVQVAPVSADALTEMLASQFGLDAFPEAEGTITASANPLTWSLYQSEVQGLNVDIAIAESEGSSALIMLLSPSVQRDTYYQGALLPAIDSFRLPG